MLVKTNRCAHRLEMLILGQVYLIYYSKGYKRVILMREIWVVRLCGVSGPGPTLLSGYFGLWRTVRTGPARNPSWAKNLFAECDAREDSATDVCRQMHSTVKARRDSFKDVGEFVWRDLVRPLMTWSFFRHSQQVLDDNIFLYLFTTSYS